MTVDPAPLPSVPAQRIYQRVGASADRRDVAGQPIVDRPPQWPSPPVAMPSYVSGHAAGRRGIGGLASGRGPRQRLDLRRHQKPGHVRALSTPLAVQQRCLWPRVRRQRLHCVRLGGERVGGSDARFIRRHALAYLRAPSVAWGRAMANGPAGWLMAGTSIAKVPPGQPCGSRRTESHGIGSAPCHRR